MERGFGIEIECHAKGDLEQTAGKLRLAFEDNLLNHSAHNTGGYGHNTDGSNTTMWFVKTDSTVYPQNTRLARKYPNNMEIVSPVLKGEEGLKALKVVCKALDGYATASKTCGLHVHFDMRGESNDRIRNLCNAWSKDEDYFFYPQPDSRLYSRFCKRWTSITPYDERIQWEPSESRSEFVAHKLKGDRRISLNVKSMGVRETMEFRLHSGTVEWPKISNWVRFVGRWVDRAMLKGKGSNTFSDFIKDMRSEELTIGSTNRILPVQETNRADSDAFASLADKSAWKRTYIHPNAKKQRVPKETTKTGQLVMMLQSGWHSKREIVNHFNGYFGEMDSGKQMKLVSGMLTNTKNLKHGFGFNIAKRGSRSNAQFRLFPIDTDEEFGQRAQSFMDIVNEVEVNESDAVIETASTIEMPPSPEELKAIDFFIERSIMFEGRRQPENVSEFSDTEAYEENL